VNVEQIYCLASYSNYSSWLYSLSLFTSYI